MNSLQEKINQDFKKAFMEQEELTVSVLRMLNSAIHNKEIEKRTKLSKTPAFAEASAGREKDVKKLQELSKLTEEETLEVASSEAKKRKDSIEEFKKGGRQDLADKETKELEILKKYLPEQMGEDAIKEIVKKAISETGVAGPKDTGKVMAAIMPQLKGKADGSVVSKIVEELLKG